MSLSSFHSPKLSLTKSFGSSLNLAEVCEDLGDFERLKRRLSSKKKSLTKLADDGSGSELVPTGTHPFKRDASERVPPDEETPLITENGEKMESDSFEDVMEKEQINFTLLLTIFIVTLGSSFQFGYGTGVMNNSEGFILDYFHDHDMSYSLFAWGTTVSSYGIGGLVGSILGPKFIGNYCGRKMTLLVNNVFLFISSYFIIFAHAWWWQAIGRIFVGIVAGIATAVVPTYFSELSPIAIRGAVGTMHQLGITIGIVVSQWLSTPSLDLLGSEEKWQYLFLVPCAFGLLQCVVLPFCPESPSYLYQTAGKEAAKVALRRLQSNENVIEVYLELIEEENEAVDPSKGSFSTADLFNSKDLRKQLIVGIAVQLMMQFSGIDAVFYYSTTIFYQAQVDDPELATTLLGIVNVLITILAVRFMDSAGRKRLLIISWVGLFVSYLVLTASFILKPSYDFMDKVSVAATTGIIIFFAFGPGCIAWFIIAEIFPLYARDTAMSVGIFINWLANWFVAFTFPHLLEYTQPYTFLVFVGTAAFFLFFTIKYVPETKGLSVAKVTKEFASVPLPTKCCGS
mmetsp:Transcript_20395/g.39296  ORF Transcript_20395/g.39296 Transcript_20395/m.39296 type:complete len:570 (-) Transcript_20395:220-1929(-)